MAGAGRVGGARGMPLLPMLLLDGGGGMVAVLGAARGTGRRTPFGSGKIFGASTSASLEGSDVMEEGGRSDSERAGTCSIREPLREFE